VIFKKYAHCAIITDGLWRKSLSAIRSLGKTGYYVVVMGDSLFTVGFWSSYANKRVRSPVASKDPNGFGYTLIQEIKTLSKYFQSIVILPMEDSSLTWVVNNREKINPFAKALIPSQKSVFIALDKFKSIQIAKKIGLPCPNTILLKSGDDFGLYSVFFDRTSSIVKPVSGSGSSGVVYRKFQTKQGFENHLKKYGPLLMQDRIPIEGAGIGVGLLFDKSSRCVASFCHKRLQQYPNSGGPSTDRISINNPELTKQSISLLKHIDWKGIGMVEWKEDTRDGVPKLMEINPRFWGSLELAVRSGVDFPKLFADLSLGLNTPVVNIYKENVRCRWIFPGDILRYITQKKDKKEKVGVFFKGFFSLSEEWDKTDIRGWFASIVCVFFQALKLENWRFLKRG
jgi:predicted ATP-grasp superfamily ATP-dependent carboligase